MDKWDIGNITEMLTWLGFFCAVFFAYYYYLRFRNKERILLIEKNMDLSEIYKKSERHLPWYMIGYTLLGIGFGLIVAFITSFIISQKIGIDEDIVLLIFLCAAILFGALGIITGHSIEQKNKKLRG